MHIKKDILLRVYACFFIMVVVGMAIVGKAYKIQVERDGHWSAIADSLSTDLISISAERGNIYSSDDRLLATSLPYFELRMDLASPAMTKEIFNDNVDGLARKMADNFGSKTYNEYKRDLIRARQRGNRYYLIKRRVDYNELNKIKTWPLFELGKYKGGLIVETKQTRKLPYGHLASRTIGYVRENAQSIGLEAEYDELLAGKEGKRLMQRIAGGTWVPLTDENAIEPMNGKDVYTSVDVNLQDVAETSLMRSMDTHDADHGCVVVMEVETGAIKAIANLGKRSDGSYGEIYNYAVGKRTEPGSTFKVASMLALLEDGHVSPDDTIDINHGHLKFYGYDMFDAGNWSPHERIPAWMVFAKSSNVGIAKFTNDAYRHDHKGLYQKLKQYHLTDRTGVSIMGEPEPYIKDPEKNAWSKLTVPWMSTGYEIQLTPLQTLTFYNAIANGGKMVKPRLVEKVLDHGKVIKTYKTEVLDKQISTPEALAQITEMMVKVVDGGTARKIKSDHYKIAGKTGTARLNDPEKGYIDKYQASFAGFYPADNPKYSCIVVVLGPSAGMTHGGSVAAPVFKEIADKVMSVDLEMHEPFNSAEDEKQFAAKDYTISVPDYRVLADQFGFAADEFANAAYVRSSLNKDGDPVFKAISFESKVIPDVRGMGLDDALFQMENAGIKVQFSGRGKVMRQSVKAGEPVVKNMTIELKLG
ncbi:MAG: transpeptidase family protein [Bacteroidetes bacterium]|nr:transpeptidase family protein [Bacteroidota bacterium]